MSPGFPHAQFRAISSNRGGFSTFYSISLAGAVSPLFGLGFRFRGLAYHGGTRLYFAVSQEASGFSVLHAIDSSGRVEARFGLGRGFTGGLAYRDGDESLYAIETTAEGFSRLHRITLAGAVTYLFGVGDRVDGGLTHDPESDLFYAVATDVAGTSMLTRIALSGLAQPVMRLGPGVSGGLSYDAEQRLFYVVASDRTRFSTLQTASLRGVVQARFGLGPGFDAAALARAPEPAARRLPGRRRGPELARGIHVRSPLPDERFIVTERIRLDATAVLDDSARVSRPPELVWRSDRDGLLGHGPTIETTLSLGPHRLEVSGLGLRAEGTVRVFADLGEFYLAPPATGELERIENDFEISWVDGASPEDRWSTYANEVFDPTSTRPSKIAALAKLDVLRHQRFAEPLPLAGGRTLYEHVRLHTRALSLRLDEGYNSAGGGGITLRRAFSRFAQAGLDPDLTPVPYTDLLQLLVHESRHNEPSDPSHARCDQAWTGRPAVPGGMDEALEGGSGYASAAMYLMWVYKHGLADPAGARARAGNVARDLLQRRLCQAPTHTDPGVQAILAELLG
jgi:hypothetical protein